MTEISCAFCFWQLAHFMFLSKEKADAAGDKSVSDYFRNLILHAKIHIVHGTHRAHNTHI